MSLIGLDIGTSGCKCTIFKIDGSVNSFSYSEYKTINLQSGYFELDPEIVWDSVKKVIYDSVNFNKGEKVTAISISSFGEAAVPVDRNGKVLANSILYMDKRGVEGYDKIEKALGKERIMHITGVSSHPMYTINKILWVKKNMPDVYYRTWKFMLFGDYIAYCLTGHAVIDYSLASRTMAFDIVSKKWSYEILEEAHVDKDIFSQLVPSGSIIGEVKEKLAIELGLPVNTLVVSGGHDQICAAVGAGILDEGLAIDGIGTVECITTVYNRPVLNNLMLKNKYNCVPYVKEGMYASYAFNFTGGSLLKWYRDTFAIREKEDAAKSGRSAYELLNEGAAKEPTNLLILPHFAGAGTPYMDTSAKGAILGLDFDTKSSDVYRALLEGVTYEMALNLECLHEAGIEITILRAVGGGSKSDLWLQIKADIMNRKVECLNVEEAGTLGAAIMAGAATGIYVSIEEAAKQLIRIKKEFYPDPNNVEIYSENYNRYKKVYKNIKKIFN